MEENGGSTADGDDNSPQPTRHQICRRTLLVALAADACISVIELVGAYASGSLALWSNFLQGIYDAILLSVNIWALEHEFNGRPAKARKAAQASDILLVFSCGVMACIAAYRLIYGLGTEEVAGGIVIMVATAAMVVNFTCAWACPRGSVNGASARFKLTVGGLIGSATVIDGVVIHVWHWHWADPALTLIFGAGTVGLGIWRITRS